MSHSAFLLSGSICWDYMQKFKKNLPAVAKFVMGAEPAQSCLLEMVDAFNSLYCAAYEHEQGHGTVYRMEDVLPHPDDLASAYGEDPYGNDRKVDAKRKKG